MMMMMIVIVMMIVMMMLMMPINGDYFVDDCGQDDVGVMMITIIELATMMMVIKVKMIVHRCLFLGISLLSLSSS